MAQLNYNYPMAWIFMAFFSMIIHVGGGFLVLWLGSLVLYMLGMFLSGAF